MLKVAIGTKNPTKVNAVKSAFNDQDVTYLPTSVPSGVSSQPFSDIETIEGAINRAMLSRSKEHADIGVGLEGGVIETSKGLFLCNWGSIYDGENEPIIAGGARILLPTQVAEGVRSGRELGDVMDEYTTLRNVRHNEGAIGVFTNGLVNRTEMFTHLARLLVGQYLYNLK